jgi:cell fate (sporulation/competence/biofilm development) regulator YlbF (YheA/YmcA/DUF963 family)
MKLLEDNSVVMTKARDLCETIAGDAEYQSLLSKVETFLGDDEARTDYQAVQQQGQELNQKQQAGLQLAESEIAEFESARTRLLENPVASDFLQAQQSLDTLQTSVSRLVGMTLELGRVPSAEDIAQASSGCCGGGGGGGCGCA